MIVISFSTAYLEKFNFTDLSLNNLYSLYLVIITKLLLIYNILLGKVVEKDDDVRDPFSQYQYFNMEDTIYDTVNDKTYVARNYSLEKVLLAILFVSVSGGFIYYKWDSEPVQALYTIVKTGLSYLLARFTIRRDDNPRTDDPNNMIFKKRDIKGKKPVRRDDDEIIDIDSNTASTSFAPNPPPAPPAPPAPPLDPNPLINPPVDVTINTKDTTLMSSLDLKSMMLNDFDPRLLKQKESYNLIRSILDKNPNNLKLSIFDSEDYHKLMSKFDLTIIKPSDYQYNLNSFKKLYNSIINNKDSSKLYNDIFADSVKFDNELKSQLSTSHLNTGDSDFMKNMKGKFKSKPDNKPTDHKSLAERLLSKDQIEKKENNLLDEIQKGKPLRKTDYVIDYNKDLTRMKDKANSSESSNPLVNQLKSLTDSDDSKKPAIFKDLDSNKDQLIQEKMDKIRQANTDFDSNYPEDPWSDQESPFSKVRFNLDKGVDQPINMNETASDYKNVLVEGKITPIKDVIKDNLIENKDSDNLTIEELIELNKNKPKPSSNIIKDNKSITKTIIENTEEGKDLSRLADLNKIKDDLQKSYEKDSVKFLADAGLNRISKFDKFELEEGTIFFESKSKSYYIFRNKKFEVMEQQLDLSQSSSTTINKTYNLDLKDLINKSNKGDINIRPSDVRKTVDTIDIVD
uniref:hypothetical protein n=1 Tax=Amanita sinensis TaxID=67728 RepID=UPI001D12365B|nr:hypothetical protein LK379_mgp29 [Amanita sinensis]QZN08160.1 hypothetical protein [Amanita sinensis]